MAVKKKSLECVTKIIQLTSATLAQEEMKFGLADNEMGQMQAIDMEYIPNIVESGGAVRGLAISLDPDSNLDPLVASEDVEDLEYVAGMYAVGADDGVISNMPTPGKTIILPNSINFGTNLGLTAKGGATQTGSFIVTIWFNRVRASAVELAKILLKRR